MDSFKLTCGTKGRLITYTQGAKGWGTIFSLMPHALILFNHFYLFTKKIPKYHLFIILGLHEYFSLAHKYFLSHYLYIISWQQVSTLKNWRRRVEWQVFFSKTQATRPDQTRPMLYKKIQSNLARSSFVLGRLNQIPENFGEFLQNPANLCRFQQSSPPTKPKTDLTNWCQRSVLGPLSSTQHRWVESWFSPKPTRKQA